MSDGPHKSLNMRRGWKTVAKLADNAASEPDDVRSVVEPALSRDWQHDVPAAVISGVCNVFGESQGSLFQDDKVSQLEAQRSMTAAHDLGHVFVDCAVKAAAEGQSGLEAASNAAAKALSIWGARHARQIEECYLRKTTGSRAENVRNQIEEALRHSCDLDLARKLLGLVEEPAPRSAQKKSGLDDGVKL